MSAEHVCGPGSGCNPRVTVTVPGTAVLVAVVVEDPDSPSGHSVQVEGRVPPGEIPKLLRAVADAYERQHRAIEGFEAALRLTHDEARGLVRAGHEAGLADGLRAASGRLARPETPD